MVGMSLPVPPLDQTAISEDFDKTAGDRQADVADTAFRAEARTTVASLSSVMVKARVWSIVFERGRSRIKHPLRVNAKQLRTDGEILENGA